MSVDRAAIVVIGNVNVDLVLGPQEPWPEPGTEVMLESGDLRIGGAAGNTALALRALGVPQRVIANVGHDVLGTWLREEFGELGTEWPVSDCATTVSVGITHPDGERTFFTSPGHAEALSLTDVTDALDAQPPVKALVLIVGTFVTPTLTADYAALLQRLERTGARIALDTGWPSGGWTPGVRERVTSWLPHCELLLLNEIETRGLADRENLDEAAAYLHSQMPASAVLVVKRGAAGALGWAGNQPRCEISAPNVRVVDTIGAGDAFNAAFLASYGDHCNLAAALEAGVEVASHAVSTSPRRYGRQ